MRLLPGVCNALVMNPDENRDEGLTDPGQFLEGERALIELTLGRIAVKNLAHHLAYPTHRGASQ